LLRSSLPRHLVCSRETALGDNLKHGLIKALLVPSLSPRKTQRHMLLLTSKRARYGRCQVTKFARLCTHHQPVDGSWFGSVGFGGLRTPSQDTSGSPWMPGLQKLVNKTSRNSYAGAETCQQCDRTRAHPTGPSSET
jgi:hypothetical protein